MRLIKQLSHLDYVAALTDTPVAVLSTMYRRAYSDSLTHGAVAHYSRVSPVRLLPRGSQCFLSLDATDSRSSC